jgi:5-formyltetrahydrofolate cyclo-ligase
MPNDGKRVAAKAAIRSRMRQRLTGLSSDERASRSKQICERILRSPEWQKAKPIVPLVPLRSEPDISGLNEEARSGQRVITTIAPTIRVETELQFGTDKIDPIVVAGLAFSRDGHRPAAAADFLIDSWQVQQRGLTSSASVSTFNCSRAFQSNRPTS